MEGGRSGEEETKAVLSTRLLGSGDEDKKEEFELDFEENTLLSGEGEGDGDGDGDGEGDGEGKAARDRSACVIRAGDAFTGEVFTPLWAPFPLRLLGWLGLLGLLVAYERVPPSSTRYLFCHPALLLFAFITHPSMCTSRSGW